MALYKFIILTIILASVLETNSQFLTHVEVHSINDCPGVDNHNGDFQLYYTVNKGEKNEMYVSGNVSLKRDFDEMYDTTLQVDQWRGNNYKERFLFLKEKYMCKALHKFIKPFFVKLSREAGVPNPDKCPIAKGNYKVENILVDLNSIKIPLMPGKYRAYLTILKGEEKHLCLEVILMFVR